MPVRCVGVARRGLGADALEIQAFRHLWGLESDPFGISLPRIAKAGYAGVEAAIQELPDLVGLREHAAANLLAIKPLLLLEGSTPDAQLAEYPELLELALKFEPAGVTVHSGRDFWSVQESVGFYRAAVRIEDEYQLEVGHETHRGRSLYSPWNTAEILSGEPTLSLVCDFSHWVVVAERMLEDLEEEIRMAATRAVHVHARVGFEQGPQVRDPRLPEAAAALAAHEAWWEMVWEEQRARGGSVTTFTPEYGPAPYLPAGLPLVDVAEVCDWQARRTRERFASWSQRQNQEGEVADER